MRTRHTSIKLNAISQIAQNQEEKESKIITFFFLLHIKKKHCFEKDIKKLQDTSL